MKPYFTINLNHVAITIWAFSVHFQLARIVELLEKMQ